MSRLTAELSTIVVSWNTRDLLNQCLDTLDAATGHLRHETIVVDNGSTDGTLEMVANRRVPAQLLANDANLGFATANNQGLGIASAPIALLLNSDAFTNADSIDRALSLLAAEPRAAIVGVRVLNTDGSLQAAQGAFPTLADDLSASIGVDRWLSREHESSLGPRPVDWVHGSCMFVRTSAFRDAGGFDPRFFMYSEEVDWCLRLWRSGWEVWYDPAATVVHLGGGSSRSHDLRRRTALYRSRLGLRRRIGGPASSAALWAGMSAGLVARVVARSAVQAVGVGQIGRYDAAEDRALLREVVTMDPLARWSRA